MASRPSGIRSTRSGLKALTPSIDNRSDTGRLRSRSTFSSRRDRCACAVNDQRRDAVQPSAPSGRTSNDRSTRSRTATLSCSVGVDRATGASASAAVIGGLAGFLRQLRARGGGTALLLILPELVSRRAIMGRSRMVRRAIVGGSDRRIFVTTDSSRLCSSSFAGGLATSRSLTSCHERVPSHRRECARVAPIVHFGVDLDRQPSRSCRRNHSATITQERIALRSDDLKPVASSESRTVQSATSGRLIALRFNRKSSV